MDVCSIMLSEKIWGSKMAMVVVDPQRKFTLPTDDWDAVSGSAVAGINRFARIFRERGIPVFFIHFDGASHVPYPGTDGDEWLKGIETDPSDVVIHKEHMNCFKQTSLEQELKSRGFDCILLAGMLTELCIAGTYYGAIERDIGAYLAKGALISYSKEGNPASEVLCNTVTEKVVETFLDGKQEPFTEFM